MIPGIVAGAPAAAPGPAPGPWTPADITTDLWLDAADAATITESGGLVSQWSDKSGNARHATQANSAIQPTVQAEAQNGLDVIRYVIDDKLDFAAGFAQVAGQNIFLCGDTTSLGTSWRQFMDRSSSTTDNLAIYIGTTSANQRPSVYWNNGAKATWGTAVQRRALFRWSFNLELPSSASALTQIDAGTPVTQDFTASQLTEWRSIGNSVQELAMDIYELVMLPPGASPENVDRMHGYLAWKWGLEANLPIGHPYKDAPP